MSVCVHMLVSLGERSPLSGSVTQAHSPSFAWNELQGCGILLSFLPSVLINSLTRLFLLKGIAITPDCHTHFNSALHKDWKQELVLNQALSTKSTFLRLTHSCFTCHMYMYPNGLILKLYTYLFNNVNVAPRGHCKFVVCLLTQWQIKLFFFVICLNMSPQRKQEKLRQQTGTLPPIWNATWSFNILFCLSKVGKSRGPGWQITNEPSQANCLTFVFSC